MRKVKIMGSAVLPPSQMASERPHMDPFCPFRMGIAFLAFILLLFALLATGSGADAAQFPFSDARWNSFDGDGASGTQFDVMNADRMSITANGSGVSTSIDQYAAFYLGQIDGDFDVRVLIENQGNTNGWAKGGITVRNDMTAPGDAAAGAGYCIVAVTPDNGYVFQYDGNGNGFLDGSTNLGITRYPSWLRLKREGNTYSAYYASLGATGWQIIGSALIASAEPVQDLGLFVSSHAPEELSSVQFAQFQGDVLNFDAGNPPLYTINADAGLNGRIRHLGGGVILGGASGDVEVVSGGNVIFSVTPDAGYDIAQVEVDGMAGSLTGGQFVFPNVTANHTFAVNFARATRTITATAAPGGTIAPDGAISVDYGAPQTFIVNPDTGYGVDQVFVDGIAVSLTGGQYTFDAVTSNQTIHVTFHALLNTIIATADSGGSILPEGSIRVARGSDQTFIVTPDAGYRLEELLVDGQPASLHEGAYTFSNVTAGHSISATFTNTPGVITDIPGCDTSVTVDNSAGFDSAALDLWNVLLDPSGKIVLETGAQAVDPNAIIVPFKQEVAVRFLYEWSGLVSDFGYILKEDAVDAHGNFVGWHNIPLHKRHPIFHNIIDEAELAAGGDGIFDAQYGLGNFPYNREAALFTYDDGTGLLFSPDGDGQVTPKDMRKVIGTFEAGTELVFFFTANTDWTTNDDGGVFFTKTAWNPDTYNACTFEGQASYDKVYHLGDILTGEGSCQTESGWLSQTALDRLAAQYGLALSGDFNLPIAVGQRFGHVVAAAPPDEPDTWIVGWEDLTGGGDADHNDMVFLLERKTGGAAQVKPSSAIMPPSEEAFYTAVTVDVIDFMPGGGSCLGKTDITYWISIDNGVSWVEISNWDVIRVSDASGNIGSDVANWSPGSPPYTYRSCRIDFAGLGLAGRELVWKAFLRSDHENCAPVVIDIALEGSVATNGSFSRASPVTLANVLYSGSFETPALSWQDRDTLRGHLRATRLYAPERPDQTAAQELWDAGAALTGQGPDARNIYYPDIAVGTVDPSNPEILATGDGSTTVFSGNLGHYPISATTLSITDGTETFTDRHTDVLAGSLGGTGTINRFTGAFTLVFDRPPGDRVPIAASYAYYSTSTVLQAFVPANVSNTLLGLDDEFVSGVGYTYDFDNDGDFDENDGDWLTQWVRGYQDYDLVRGLGTPKEWLLGAIDHAVPALATPPGTPGWFFGTDITSAERSEYRAYADSLSERKAIAYVGSRSGMIHAFDAGQFRWGDNPETGFAENRGYFRWETPQDPSSVQYGTGRELWGFIPANLLPRLKNNLLQRNDQAYVDASATLADVKTDIRDGNGTQWRTVLISAQGNGGDSIFCLDVTDPDHPFFIWEFADPDLFRSRSSPAVVRIGRIFVNGSPRWAAFFVSGKSDDNTLFPSVYIIDVADGSVIDRVFLDEEPLGVGGVPSGQPAVVDSDGNGYVDRLYIGSDKGYLYKVTIPDNPDALAFHPSHCVINGDFTDEEGNVVPLNQRWHPIYASPTVVTYTTFNPIGDIQYDIKVFFGTGDSPFFDENINTSETRYHFFAYSDTDGKGACNQATLDWFLELPEGHRIWASAFAAAGQIYFGTATEETEDPCLVLNRIGGNLMVYRFGGTPVQLLENVGQFISAPLVADEHLYFRTPEGLTSIGSGNYNTAVKLGGSAESTVRWWKERY